MAWVEAARTQVRRRTVLAAAIGLAAIASATCAAAAPDPVELTVVDRATGQPLKVWRRHGRLFVAGEPGQRYSLRVTNNTQGRILAIMSVDGVNIFTGETAAYDQRGYIFNPHESYEVKGWRKSLEEVADFTFAPLSQSYAARTGRPSEVGVIGMAVFNEKTAPRAPIAAGAAPPPAPPPPPPSPAPAAPPPPAPPAPAAPLAPSPSGFAESPDRSAEASTSKRVDEKLGTAHGVRERSVTFIESFERATPFPQAVTKIEYDTVDHLVAIGVIPRAFRHHPQPFPARPAQQGFVPDPPDAP